MKHSVTLLAALTLTGCVVNAPPDPSEPDATLQPHRSGFSGELPQVTAPGPAVALHLAAATTAAGTPVTLASGEQGIVSMSVHSGTVYWSTYGLNDNGSVLACPLSGCGGVPTTLASGTSNATTLVANSSNVYWGGGRTIFATPVAGGPTTTVATLHKAPGAIAYNGSHLFWGNGVSSGNVMKCSLDGCATPVTLASAQDSPQGLALDSTNVYWTTFYGGTVVSEPLGGGTTTTLAASSNAGSYGIAVDSQNIYWANFNTGTVEKCAIGGCGGQPTVLASGQADPIALAVDSTSVYFVNYAASYSGSLAKVPIVGGAVTTLASGQLKPVAVALTPTEVVWATATAVIKLGR